MKVIIEPHNPQWRIKFLEIKRQLQQTLEGIPVLSIEHVGSTSIPGLLAKPVLDVDIIIQPSSLEATRRAMSQAGFTDCGEMNIPGRFVFRQPGYGRFDAAHGPGKDGELRYNTYVMIDGCTSLRNHLDVKRLLMENQALRNEYGRVKQALRDTEFEKIDCYVIGKSEILCRILKEAGWSELDLEPVIKANSQSRFEATIIVFIARAFHNIEHGHGRGAGI